MNEQIRLVIRHGGVDQVQRVLVSTIVVSVITVSAVLVSTGAGCTVILPDDEEVTILAWNVENLFDAVDQGTEYPEFTVEGGWTERDYQARKRRVAEAVHSLRPKPDVMVFVEIENEHVLNALVDDYIVDIHAPYRAFTKGPGAAIGIGLASRYPVTEVLTHLARSGEFPPLRPVLEVHLDIDGEPIVVFANHWKSKRGGAPATEPLRRASAALLATRLQILRETHRSVPIVVTGDFNERPREFELTGRSYPTALMPAEEVAGFRERLHAEDDPPWWVTEDWFRYPDYLLLAPDEVEARRHEKWSDGPVLVNLWDSSDAPGSFFFIHSWERIDAMYISPVLFEPGGLEFRSFAVPCVPDGCDSQGRPLSWEDDPRGVSDHMPLLLTLARSEA